MPTTGEAWLWPRTRSSTTIQYFFTRDLRTSLNYVSMQEMVAALLTEALARAQHEHLNGTSVWVRGLDRFVSVLGSQRGGVSENGVRSVLHQRDGEKVGGR